MGQSSLGGGCLNSSSSDISLVSRVTPPPLSLPIAAVKSSDLLQLLLVLVFKAGVEAGIAASFLFVTIFIFGSILCRCMGVAYCESRINRMPIYSALKFQCNRRALLLYYNWPRSEEASAAITNIGVALSDASTLASISDTVQTVSSSRVQYRVCFVARKAASRKISILARQVLL